MEALGGSSPSSRTELPGRLRAGHPALDRKVEVRILPGQPLRLTPITACNPMHIFRQQNIVFVVGTAEDRGRARLCARVQDALGLFGDSEAPYLNRTWWRFETGADGMTEIFAFNRGEEAVAEDFEESLVALKNEEPLFV